MSYHDDRSRFREAAPVNFNRGVVPRISPDGTELWLGLPIFFVAYDPPNGASQATVRVRGSGRTIVPWEHTFDSWKWEFIQSIHGCWDRKFVLERTGIRRSSTRAGVLSMGPRSATERVIARFHPYEVSARDHAKMAPLCFRAASSDPMQTSSCHFFGAYKAAAAQLPQGANVNGRFTSMLDSNDMKEKHPAALVNGQEVATTQYGAHHETGHHLGLMHRCTNRSFGGDLSTSVENWYPAHRRFSHPEAAQDRRAGGDYCDGSNSEEALNDLMAMGDQLHPWHAGLWVDVVQHVISNGYQYGVFTWRALMIE